MNTKKIEKTESGEAVPEERDPTVDPKRVAIADENQCWRSVLVRMPKDAIADDLRNPKIWKRVQATAGVGLTKFDHLLILGYDESWMARAIVTAASHTEAHLVIEKVSGFREQAESHFNDGRYEVYWNGDAYAVRRIADGVAIGGVHFGTVGQAIAYINTSLYPRKVA